MALPLIQANYVWYRTLTLLSHHVHAGRRQYSRRALIDTQSRWDQGRQIGPLGRLRDKRPSEVVARSLPTEASMARIDHSRWLATANIARFRELLVSSTDSFQRKQLEELLARELKRLAELRGIAGKPPTSRMNKPPALAVSTEKTAT